MKTISQLHADRNEVIAQLRANRDQAGERYAAAARAYVDAYVELHAYDLALASRTGDNSGFAALNALNGHPKYLRDPLNGGAVDRAQIRSVEIIASFAAADSEIEQLEAAERAAGRAHIKSLEA
jgi:hypothetical protein